MNEQLVIDWAYLAPLEQTVKGSEGTAVRARWEFGCYLRDYIPRSTGGRGNVGPLQAIAAELIVSEQELRFRRQFAERYPTEEKLANALASFGSWFEIVTRGLRESREQQEKPPPPAGRYRTITLDPPWPIEKIEREVRPRQDRRLDYSTMTIEEIEALPIAELAASDGCHIYLWVTHRFLPDGLRLLEEWGAEYQCQLTWMKPSGMTPYSWMYDTEHALFAHVGSLPLQELGQRLSLQAPVERHSAKPPAFYERVCRVSPEPRLAMFERGEREGFVVWGDEVAA